MSDLTAERDALVARARERVAAAMWPTIYNAFQFPTPSECVKEAERQVDELLSLHRSALAGETDDKVLWRAIEATYTDANCERIEKELDKQGAGPATVENHVGAAIRAAAPILRAPLLVQLQDKNERIKALEGVAREYNALHDRLMARNWSSRSVLEEVEATMRGDA